MKRLRLHVLTLILAFSFPVVSFAQANTTGSNRVWYSTYINKKLNHRWSVDNFTLLALRSFNHDLWLAQTNIGANYRVDRFITLTGGYGHSLYKYTGAWWDRHYPNITPSSFNTISFHTVYGAIKHQKNVGHKLRWANQLRSVVFIPRMEKFQTRLQWSTRLSYRRSNLPLRLRPFVQGILYYYLNGVEATYYDETDNGFIPVETASPDGLHRFRLRVGASFKPVRDFRPFSMTIYYGYNREFNGVGNDLNFPRPSRSGRRTFTTYPFNNYSIFGLQANFFLR